LITASQPRLVSQKKICIGVCAYNEEKNIGFLLKNLLTQQDLHADCEIIVACSGCTDSTPKIVKSYQKLDKRVKLILEDERRGKAHALNRIFEHASGFDVLILTNADALPDNGSINQLVKALKNENAGAAAGRPVPLNRSSRLPGMITELIWDLHHEVSICESVKMSGELCAIRSSLINRIPLNLATDEPYIEMMIRRQGYNIEYIPDARVYVRCPETVSEIIGHRRRIWAGHLQIRRMEAFTVSTSDFRKILSTLVKSFKSNSRKLHVLALFVALEIYSYLLARYDLSKGRIPFMWKTLKSTKTMLAGNVKRI